MARDEVFYIGEPVAAVAADDEMTAREALELVEIAYRDLEAVVDPLEALDPGATAVHPGPGLLRRIRFFHGRK